MRSAKSSKFNGLLKWKFRSRFSRRFTTGYWVAGMPIRFSAILQLKFKTWGRFKNVLKAFQKLLRKVKIIKIYKNLKIKNEASLMHLDLQIAPVAYYLSPVTVSRHDGG